MGEAEDLARRMIARLGGRAENQAAIFLYVPSLLTLYFKAGGVSKLAMLILHVGASLDPGKLLFGHICCHHCFDSRLRRCRVRSRLQRLFLTP